MTRKLFPILLANILLWSTATFFLPLTIFLNNRLEIPATLLSTLAQTTLITIIGIVICSIIAYILSPKLSPYIVSLTIVLSLLIWAQSNLLLVNYGVLDGNEIDWSQYATYGLLDGILWLLCIVLAIKYYKHIHKHLITVTVFLITTQAIALGFQLYTAPSERLSYQYTSDHTHQFTFSKDRNAVIIVLDTFQTNYFNYIIEKHPEYQTQLDGFNYFPNSTAGFNSTAPSIPLILSGQYYNNFQPILDFTKEVFNNDSLPKFLKDNHFQNDLFPLPDGLVQDEIFTFSPNIVDNIKSVNQLENLFNISNIKKLLHLTWFRGAPQFLKPTANTVTQALLANSSDSVDIISFLHSLKQKIQTSDLPPQFKLYHLWGMHPPLSVNQDLSYESMSFTPQDYQRAAKGCVEMLKEFITTLKSAGVYDQTMIVVVGDHGAGLPIDAPSSPNGVAENIRARGLPLVLVKPFTANHPLQIISSPVSLEDIYKTIASSINPQTASNLPGFDIMGNNIPEDRQRQYFFYNWTLDFWTRRQDYLPAMRKYLIDGNSWDYKSWHDTREIYYNGHEEQADTNYTIDSIIDFSKTESQKYQVGGWSYTEPTGTWTLGSHAVIELNKLPQNRDLILNLDLTPFQTQQIDLLINDHPLSSIDLSENIKYQITIPAQFIKGTQDIIEFNISTPKSPLELGFSPDERQIGLLVSSMRISMAPTYDIGTTIHFTTQDFNAAQWMNLGWSSPEADGTWTIGNRSNMSFSINQPLKTALKLQANLIPMTSSSQLDSQKVQIEINEQIIGEWKVDHSGMYTVKIPLSVLNSPNLRIVFSVPNATSPASLGKSIDTRKLGVLFKTLRISDAES